VERKIDAKRAKRKNRKCMFYHKTESLKAVRLFASTHYKEHFRSKMNGTQDTTINYEKIEHESRMY
jgi:hypothetical protein